VSKTVFLDIFVRYTRVVYGLWRHGLPAPPQPATPDAPARRLVPLGTQLGGGR
jgi:hypothetical protein